MRLLGYVTVVVVGMLAFACDRSSSERPRSTTITVGETVRGQLSEDDWTDVFADRSYTDLYDITLTAGQQITVELSSDEVDTYLSILRGPGDQLVDNDDIEPGQNTNSRVTYLSQAEARLFIAATTFRPGQAGAYTLSVREGAPDAEDAAAPPSNSTKGDSPRAEESEPQPSKAAPAE